MLQLTLQSSLVLGGLSYHIGAREYTYKNETRHFNERNLTIGYEHDGWSVVQFNNSYYEPSVMVTKGYGWWFKDVYQGVQVGAVTGYGDTPMNYDLLPMGQFELGYRTGPVTSIIGWIPSGKVSVLTLHWKYTF